MSKRPKAGVGPWAKEKLDALGEYLNFYTKVLKNQSHWCKGTIYIDAFAGPGRARVRATTRAAQSDYASLFQDSGPHADPEAVEFLKGSPRVALDIENPFTWYIFIDQDPVRIAELKALKHEYATVERFSFGTAMQEMSSKRYLIGIRTGELIEPSCFLIPLVCTSPGLWWRHLARPGPSKCS
jgi:three-Cys-motif partner protein